MNFLPKLHTGLSGLMVLVSACANVPVPPAGPSELAVATEFAWIDDVRFSPEDVEANWWQGFGDDELTDFVELALASNTSLEIASANIETAAALLAARRLGRSPVTAISVSGDIGRSPTRNSDTEASLTSSIGASWEYDAFGRIAAQIESSAFDLANAENIRRDVAVTVAANTALAYADLRGGQVRLDVARRNVTLQKEGLDLLSSLFENGRATQLDLARAQAQYRTTLAAIPALEADITNAGSRLAVLTGVGSRSANDRIERAIAEPGVIPVLEGSLNVGTPAALIRRRPDIRAAEADIASRLALGEFERARLFPTITFNADLSSLFREDNTSFESFGFGIGPAIRWDGPDLRRVYADIDVADSLTMAAMARYQDTVVSALGEVEIALTNYSLELARRADLEAAAASAERALELARLRFQEGVDDYLDVIDAQRTLLVSQDTLENSKLETTRRAIAAYRALGGVWSTTTLDAAQIPQEG